MSFPRPLPLQAPPPPQYQQPPPLPPHYPLPHPRFPLPPPQTQRPLKLELTILSAKHLKNVNWKNGDLKPYVILWVDPDNKLITKSDDSFNTKPFWNQSFTLPIQNLHDVVLTLEVFHSKTTQTPKPFVGSAQIPISSLSQLGSSVKAQSFDLLRPSGRPHGKIKLKFCLKEQLFLFNQGVGHNYHDAPQVIENFFPLGYYFPHPPPFSSVMRSFSDRNVNHGAPSAPVDYSPFETRVRGVGTGFGVGAVTGMLSGVALDDGVKYEEDNVGGSSVKDDLSEYRGDY